MIQLIEIDAAAGFKYSTQWPTREWRIGRDEGERRERTFRSGVGVEERPLFTLPLLSATFC